MRGLLRTSALALVLAAASAPLALAATQVDTAPPVAPTAPAYGTYDSGWQPGYSAPVEQTAPPAAAPSAAYQAPSGSDWEAGYSQPVQQAAAPTAPPAYYPRPVRFGWLAGHSAPMWFR